jgi:CMP-N-acetylneuraminic acid synthetase
VELMTFSVVDVVATVAAYANQKQTGMTLIIPARGGSKRIPGKNIRPFLGAPILTYPIRVAQESGLFSRIVVSTDDGGIADVATAAGAEVFWRSMVTASDTASVEDVAREVVGDSAPCAITYPTSVFATPDLWLEAYGKLEPPVECVYSALPASKVYRARTSTGWLFPQYRDSRTQDLPAAHFDAAQLYLVARVTDSILDLPSAQVTVPLAVDIDNPGDWVEAEMLYKNVVARHGEAGQGAARRGTARCGMAGQGAARPGGARRGKGWQQQVGDWKQSPS